MSTELVLCYGPDNYVGTVNFWNQSIIFWQQDIAYWSERTSEHMRDVRARCVGSGAKAIRARKQRDDSRYNLANAKERAVEYTMILLTGRLFPWTYTPPPTTLTKR